MLEVKTGVVMPHSMRILSASTFMISEDEGVENILGLAVDPAPYGFDGTTKVKVKRRSLDHHTELRPKCCLPASFGPSPFSSAPTWPFSTLARFSYPFFCAASSSLFLQNKRDSNLKKGSRLKARRQVKSSRKYLKKICIRLSPPPPRPIIITGTITRKLHKFKSFRSFLGCKMKIGKRSKAKQSKDRTKSVKHTHAKLQMPKKISMTLSPISLFGLT